MLSWSEMQGPLGKVLFLLTLSLVLANAHCFAHCLVARCDSGAMPCHQSKTPTVQCAHGHDLTGPAAHEFVFGELASAGIAYVPALPMAPLAMPAFELLAEASPGGAAPLRI